MRPEAWAKTVFTERLDKLAKKRMLMELGMGTALREEFYEGRAAGDRRHLWHNSVNLAEAFGSRRPC